MMTKSFLKRIFGSRNERVLRQLSKTVAEINALEPRFQALSDEQLKAKTDEFRQRLRAGETLDQLLPEAFAAVREASVRTLKMRHFDVQLIGGIALYQGKIAEMRTGEGKTLAATLPVYLNALAGKGVHVVTVNDYLAKRDAEWMCPIYTFLGMTTGVILSGMQSAAKREAYHADITYGTNNEFGFDYLRDNMAFSLTDRVMRELYYAIVDEVDSILIDEARTPLIISGAAEDGSELYLKIKRLIPYLTRQEKENEPGDFTLDEKTRQAYLTEAGHQRIEEMLAKEGLLGVGQSLYDAVNISLVHHVYTALRAHALFQRDVDYIVHNNQIVIVDEHTGRTMPGRRWSDGLHQAIEAKEGVPIQHENQTLASITFQNYFRLYEKLAGMTGTADTEAYEFQQIYGLEVVVIPTNQPMRRTDYADKIYLSAAEKFRAVIADIQECLARKQPVLVGTASIETSEYLSGLLKQLNVPHQVLNAKFHEQEAQIIAEAGRPGTVTIATNMAGRGTDIVLGGKLAAEIAALTDDPTEEGIAEVEKSWQARHEQVVVAGGLHVIGSERHESRRIDNQLRGRSGRQGDPGSSRFYLSLQDNLMRIFASERVAMIMQKLGMKEGEVIEHSLVTKAIENAQRKVEAHNFGIRKQLLEYDDVANDQRKVIYAYRTELMGTEDISDTITEMRQDVVQRVIDTYIPLQSLEEQWDIPGLTHQLQRDFGLPLPIQQWLAEEESLHEESLRQRILDEAGKGYRQKEMQLGSLVMRQLEKTVMLQNLDMHWKEHLAAMDHLRQGIHLRGYAQKNPKQEYKREAFELFAVMWDNVKHDVISILSRIQVHAEADLAVLEQQRREAATIRELQFQHAEATAMQEVSSEEVATISEHKGAEVLPFIRPMPKVGRNEACPCGSGKKYKHCHGQLER